MADPMNVAEQHPQLLIQSYISASLFYFLKQSFILQFDQPFMCSSDLCPLFLNRV